MPEYPPEVYELLNEPVPVQRNWPLTKFIVISCVLVFAVQVYFEEFRGSEWFTWVLCASRAGLKHGYWWQVITYAWVHSVQLPIHIIFNLMMIYPLGREVERTVGSAKYALIYFGSVLAGAAAFFLFSDSGVELIAGASAAAFGLVTSIAVLYPNRQLDVLLFFVIPLRMRIKRLAMLVCGIEIICQVFGWLAFISHIAHLGGALAGLIITWLIKPKSLLFQAGFSNGKS